MKSPLERRFTQKKEARQAKRDILSQSVFREVHLHSERRRTPLERLESVRELISNGLNSGSPIKLCFAPDPKIHFPKIIHFPSRSFNESMKFSMCVRVLSILIENLKKGYTATRRDIYYQDVELFQNQGNVDMIIGLVCSSLGFKDFEINAIASQKGLFYGDVTFVLSGNVRQDYSKSNGAQLIPRVHEVIGIQVPNEIEYVLVIEKEAVFHALLNPSKKRILITGKGYPDQLTKSFLSKLSTAHPSLPIIGFADLDPYGINIMRMYKTGGSMPEYSCPSLTLSKSSILDFVKTSTCLTLPLRDFTMCQKMLEKEAECAFDDIKIEIQRMMFLGKKAELDVAKTGGSKNRTSTELDISRYIDLKIERLLQSKKKQPPISTIQHL